MTDAGEPSVVLALGIDPEVDYTVPDDVWDSLIRVAFDPNTPESDASVVPIMDDDGTVPDTGATDDSGIAHADDAHGAHHPSDHAAGDDGHHGGVADHAVHDADTDHDEPDLGTHHTEHDHDQHGYDPHDDDHPGTDGHQSDWHA